MLSYLTGMKDFPFTEVRDKCAAHCLQTLNFLAVLEAASKGRGITETAAALGISRVAVTLALNSLEFAGILEKHRQTEGDKRRTTITLTPDGERLMRELEAIFDLNQTKL